MDSPLSHPLEGMSGPTDHTDAGQLDDKDDDQAAAFSQVKKIMYQQLSETQAELQRVTGERARFEQQVKQLGEKNKQLEEKSKRLQQQMQANAKMQISYTQQNAKEIEHRDTQIHQLKRELNAARSNSISPLQPPPPNWRDTQVRFEKEISELKMTCSTQAEKISMLENQDTQFNENEDAVRSEANSSAKSSVKSSANSSAIAASAVSQTKWVNKIKELQQKVQESSISERIKEMNLDLPWNSTSQEDLVCGKCSLKMSESEKEEWISEHIRIQQNLDTQERKTSDIETKMKRLTSTFESDKAGWRKKEETLNSQVRQKDDENIQLRSRMNLMESRLNSQIEDLSKKLKEGTARKEDIDAQHAMFVDTKKQLHIQLEIVQRQNVAKSKEVDSLNDVINKMVTKQHELTNQVITLQTELTRTKKGADMNQNAFNTKENQLRSDLTIQSRHLKKAEGRMSDAEKILAQTSLDLRTMKERLKKTSDELTTATKDLEREKSEKDLLRRHKKQLAKEILSLRDNLTEQQTSSTKYIAKIQILDSTVENLEKTVRKKEDAIKFLEAEVPKRLELQRQLELSVKLQKEREEEQERLIATIDCLKSTLENMSVQRLRSTLLAPNTTDVERLELSNKGIKSILPEIKVLRKGLPIYKSAAFDDVDDMLHTEDRLMKRLRDLFSEILLSNARLRMKMNNLVDRVLQDVDVIK